jgi:tetratricopeptide (TPR) repeat protein
MGNLALSYAELGQHADALKLREKTLALATIRLGPTHQQTLWLMMGLADSQAALGRNLDALNLREKTLTLARANLESDHLTTLLIMHGLADSYAAVGREADALALHEDTLARMKAKLGPGHPATLNSMAGAAKSLIKLDRGAEAVPVIDECLRRATARFVDRTLFPELLELRSQQFAKWAESLGCRQTAEMWEKLNRTDAQSLYTAARLRAVSAAVLRQDKTEEIAKQADAEANLAMDWLQKAVAAGFQDVNRMNKETDFDFLRERADFRNLVAKLEAVRKNEMR